MNRPDWKTTFIAAAARFKVASHFLRCLRLIDAGMLEEAERCMARDAWRKGVDLTGVPPEVVEKTEALCSRARGGMEHGNAEALGETVDEIVDLWT
jgi:hypothetical protein